MSFPHVFEDDQRSLILARSLSHPPFDFHITGQGCNITSISPRARSKANTKRKKILGNRFKGIILLLIITSQGTRVQHNKMICRVQALVCMVKVPGHDYNSLNIHNHRPIIMSLEKSVHHDKTMYHISPRLRSQATLLFKTCCRSIICKAFNQISKLST